ncbi:MAG: hypothetical protein MI863_26785 [Desulfobacterales bacterium]|nr:hypothetical protein [Desulfobacterales bacterium]
MKTDVVVAGWGQVTQSKTLNTPPEDPMGLMVQASRSAANILKDPAHLAEADGILVVKSLSAHYENPAEELAGRIHATPGFLFESRIGGNSPQTLINRAAGMIARKELNMALVVGAEAYVPRTDSAEKLDSALLQGIPEDYTGDDVSGVTPLEARYGIEHPMQGFPLFETALWAASGKKISPYLEHVADFWSKFSLVARNHPHAWCRQPKTPEEILTPSQRNRPIAFPYTKFMNAFITVDQGAAVILMSADYARSHGPAKGKPVYFCGGGYSEDRQPYMIQKTDFTSSPPLKAAVDKALDRSGIPLSDIDSFDIYSCFPCAVSIAKKMMGLRDDDPRAMTLTGGLGFFGGPGNNYNLHAIATLCERISSGKATTGLTTALGWFMQKHAAGIYSALPPKNNLNVMDIEDRNDYLAGPEPIETDPNPSGTGTIETYTIIYNRDQTPAYAVIYGRTGKNLRFIARTPENREIFQTLAEKNMVGKMVTIENDPKTNLTIARFK